MRMEDDVKVAGIFVNVVVVIIVCFMKYLENWYYGGVEINSING